MISALLISVVLAADPIASPLQATVKRVGELDVEIEVNGKPGRVPYGETSWRADERPTELFHVRDVIEVMPLRRGDIDNVQLYSRRLATKDPWPEISAKLPEGKRAKATVKAVDGSGYRVTVAGIDASLKSDACLRKLQVGEEIDVVPIIVRDGDRAALELVQIDSAPADGKKVRVGSVVNAAIRIVTANAALIDLGDGVQQVIRPGDVRNVDLSRLKAGTTLRLRVKQTAPTMKLSAL